MLLTEQLIFPDWPAPKCVRALQTTRLGGISTAPYDSFNLALHVEDYPITVQRNRQKLSSFLPSEPVWLEQVHGTAIANADAAACREIADASIARQAGSVCAVLTADCLPILLCDQQGSVVAAIHAGWRGLSAGIITKVITEMGVANHTLLAWLGPAISATHFEVGAEVRDIFMQQDADAHLAFYEGQVHGKYFADLYLLARQQLNKQGVTQIYGGDYCTYQDSERFYSHRRDGQTGRTGTFIWLEN